VVLSLLFTWTGLAVAYFTIYPVGFFITTLAFVAYVVIRTAKAMSRRNVAEPA
jgi:zinc/manganese transport system permease protein